MSNPNDKQYIYPDMYSGRDNTGRDKEVNRIIREVQGSAASQSRESDLSVDQVLRETLGEKSASPAAKAAPATPESSPAPAAAPKPAPAAAQAVQLTSSGTQQPPSRRKKESRLHRLFCNLIPQRGDGAMEVVRKCLFMLAFLTLVSSAVYIVHDTVWIPTQNESMNNDLQELFHQGMSGSDEERQKMMQELYARNNDFRAWLTYTATGDDFLQIDYPVMYHGDNSYYLEHDFNNNYNKNGTLFFDERNNYTLTSAENKVSIIYGHNMNSGQMFAHLNLFLRGVEYARAAPLIQMETFFGTEYYKVFAVIVTNTKESDGPVFDYLRVSFSDDTDFLNYVNQYRARSLFDYDSVDVQANDELLVLSTCTTVGGVSFDDGRLAVIARKVRVGESTAVDTTQITSNADVIMPYAWYVNQDMTPHAYYSGGYVIPTVTTMTTTTTVADSDDTPLPTKDDFEEVETTTTPPVDVEMTGNGRTTTTRVTVGSYTNASTTAPTTTTSPPTATTPPTDEPEDTTPQQEPEDTTSPPAQDAGQAEDAGADG